MDFHAEMSIVNVVELSDFYNTYSKEKYYT